MLRALALLLCSTSVFCQFSMTRLAYHLFPFEGSTLNFMSNAAHRAAYHSPSRMLYVLGAQTDTNRPRLLHVVNIANPATPSVVYTHQFNPTENGRANDVEVCADTVVVSLESSQPAKEGHVEFFTPYQPGNPNSFQRIGRETVGVHPKGMAFTSDCQKVVVANEGRGERDVNANQFVDSPGSVSIILRSDGGFPAVVTIDFRNFIGGREQTYLNRGVRWVYRGNHQAGIVNTFADDLEPERVTLSRDDRFAYISLPENNAIARIDINNYNINEIFALGVKNWTLYDMDGSDVDGGANLIRHPAGLYSMYEATDIKTATLNGAEYIVSANQGVIKRYSAVELGTAEFDESRTARTVAMDNEFDTTNWPPAMSTAVNSDSNLGRLKIKYVDAKDLISNRIKDVIAYGGRSGALWSTATMTLAYDTGDELATKEAETYALTFNGEASDAGLSPVQQADLRSDDQGTEPTSVGVGTINIAGGGSLPIIVMGTRTGYIHLYSDSLTLPNHEIVFREGQTGNTWSNLYNNREAGHALISDIGIISNAESPDGTVLVYVIGSGTGSLGIYRVSFT